ncbi:MAG TPA: type II toxin-antitoxin system RelE/ParE family toxin [Flavobacteriales bacterium]|nr:type II toxin-antitoxin system RelE/ParE family toxin [Flavobacteriales bacterium]
MKYRLRVDPKAIQEMWDVYHYREGEKRGQGERFIDELVECYASIKANPHGYQVRKGHYRHAYLRKLKYRVVYEVEGNDIFVYQVRHTSRKPSRKFGP